MTDSELSFNVRIEGVTLVVISSIYFILS